MQNTTTLSASQDAMRSKMVSTRIQNKSTRNGYNISQPNTNPITPPADFRQILPVVSADSLEKEIPQQCQLRMHIPEPAPIESALSYFLQRRVWGRGREEIARNRITNSLQDILDPAQKTNGNYDEIISLNKDLIIQRIQTVIDHTYGEKANTLTPEKLALLKLKFVRNYQLDAANCFDLYVKASLDDHALVIRDQHTMTPKNLRAIAVDRKDVVTEFARKKTHNNRYRWATQLMGFGLVIGGIFRLNGLFRETGRVFRDNRLVRGDIAATQNPALATPAINLANNPVSAAKMERYFEQVGERIKPGQSPSVRQATQTDIDRWHIQLNELPIR